MTTQQTARIAKISYRLNAGRTDGASIPLGLLAEFRIALDTSVLVLFTRKKLTEKERGQMDWIARSALASPMKYFQGEVDAAMAGGGDPFTRLAEKFSWSINVSSALEVPIPEEIAGKLSEAVQVLANSADAKASVKKPARRAPKKIEFGAMRIILDPTVANFAVAAAPEFSGIGDLSTYVPEPWMLPASSSSMLTQ